MGERRGDEEAAPGSVGGSEVLRWQRILRPALQRPHVVGIPLRPQSEAFLPLPTLGPDPHGPPQPSWLPSASSHLCQALC